MIVAKKIKRFFLTGLLVLLPLGVTFFILQILLTKVGQPASNLFFKSWIKGLDARWIQFILWSLSVGIVILIITGFGWLSQYVLGKWFLGFTEKFIENIPLLNSVYKTVKQLVETLSKGQKNFFQKAVLVPFPSKGIYSIGFLTSTGQGEVQEKTKEHIINVFVPTTPNPTSGFLVLIPEKDVIFLEMSVGDAMKMIISGGAMVPSKLPSQNL